MRILALLLCLSTLSVVARADIYITVTGSGIKRAKLAVGQVHPLGDSPSNPSIAKKLQEQLMLDLQFINLFEFLNASLVVPYDQPGDLYTIKYDELSKIGASFMLKLGYKVDGSKLVLEGLMYDITGKKKVFGTRYQYPMSQYHRLVHALSEDILKELTGERGLFFSRVAMVCWDKKRRDPPKEIFVADTDGRNLTQITFDKTLTLSPSWSPDGKFLTYTQYEWHVIRGVKQKGTTLKRHNLTTGNRGAISAKQGMNSGAAWMPNGKKIAATLSFSSRPEIYLLDPNSPGDPEPFSRNIQWKKMAGDGFQANNPSLLFDVEPNFNPDGTKMVLSSARSGHPMIYVVDMASKTAQQLTFAGTYNASPAWSPKGDKILFAAQRTGEGNFDLYLIDPDGNNLARVTNGERTGRRVNSENASWSPTGRHFAFSNNEGGGYNVYVMTLDGTQKRRISPPNKECKTPSWGPSEG